MQKDRTITVGVQDLLKRVREGKSAEEMMSEFEIPSRAALESALVQVMQKTGEEVHSPGLIGRASVNPRYTRGGKRVDPQMLAGTGQEEAVSDFNVTIDRGVISITQGDHTLP